jgi:environmental stress-induced protein Ves
MVVAGNGMELTMQDGIAARVAERYRPFRFSGDAHTRCRLLDGPVHDFNVISARGKIEHHCDVISGDVHEAAWTRTHTVFAHCLNGNLIVKLRGLAEWTLGAGQSLWFTARPEGETAPILFAPHSPQSVAVVVTLRHLQIGT